MEHHAMIQQPLDQWLYLVNLSVEIEGTKSQFLRPKILDKKSPLPAQYPDYEEQETKPSILDFISSHSYCVAQP
jgi:hypothetical protein